MRDSHLINVNSQKEFSMLQIKAIEIARYHFLVKHWLANMTPLLRVHGAGNEPCNELFE
jgi:hypothetical protein